MISVSLGLQPRLAAAYTADPVAAETAAAVEASPPGQTALFIAWEDAVECAKCGGRMVRTGQLLHVPRLLHEHRRQLDAPRATP